LRSSDSKRVAKAVARLGQIQPILSRVRQHRGGLSPVRETTEIREGMPSGLRSGRDGRVRGGLTGAERMAGRREGAVVSSGRFSRRTKAVSGKPALELGLIQDRFHARLGIRDLRGERRSRRAAIDTDRPERRLHAGQDADVQKRFDEAL